MNRRIPKTPGLLLLSLCSFLLSLHLTAQSPADRREEMKEWIKIQKILSEEQAEWKVEKAVIEDMIRILQQEKEDLQGQIEVGKSAVTSADTKRAELEAARDELRAATGSLETALPTLEASIKTLYTRFPEPLQQTLQPLINRLPEPGAATRLSLSERLQTVVGILSQADRFNSVITDVSENRDLSSGAVIVQTLYFGLAGAIYADPAGQTAGILIPTPTGWESRETPEHTEAILQALLVYASLSEATFVELPVSIQ